MRTIPLALLVLLSITACKKEVAGDKPATGSAKGSSDVAKPVDKPADPKPDVDPVTEIPDAPEECAGKDCARLALPLMKTEPAKGLPLLKKGCTTGDGISCGMLALAFKEGTGIAKNAKATLALNERSCELDYAKGCYNLGLQLFNGEGVPADEARGITALEKACNGKAWRACGSLGDHYLNTGKKDKALAILKLGCDNADPLSCETLAKAK